MAFMVTLFLNFILMFSLASTGNSLSYNYYEKTCPDVEFIVAKTVRDATASDKTVPAALLRLHFHDCFIRVMLQKESESYIWRSHANTLNPNLKESTFYTLFCHAYLHILLYPILFVSSKFFEGMWCFCAAKLKRKQQSRKRWTTKCILACILYHW